MTAPSAARLPRTPRPRETEVCHETTPRALARAGGERLVAYRQRGTGFACLSIGRHATECGHLAHWRARVPPGPVAPLFTTRPDASGLVAVWGASRRGCRARGDPIPRRQGGC